MGDEVPGIEAFHPNRFARAHSLAAGYGDVGGARPHPRPLSSEERGVSFPLCFEERGVSFPLCFEERG